ncbi:properdin-like [Hippocampus zosterae]|uniref:properdin-like n=1 Tax=Hippocampus zosterae TaxID=109293 RepID=UPI00223D7D7E|nr:properdin-like [Hippocampus zosterae]
MKNIRKLLVIFIILMCVKRAQSVKCFARFEWTSGICEEELGDLDEDDCCLNPQYAYLTQDGDCQSCGPPKWTDWSPWSPCTTLCGEGVTQRSRKCFGIGQPECNNALESLQTKPCNGTCCSEGWSAWLPWSPCSATCGGSGVSKQVRLCSATPECLSACSGATEIVMSCDASGKCPVHGGWSPWSSWSLCSSNCVRDDAAPPFKQRRRSCSDPAPSADTKPPGDGCKGDDVELQNCSDIPKCPVDGNWGEWLPPGPCSAQCGEGLKLSIRHCDQPAPKYGGQLCVGPNARTYPCHITCAVDGSWSGWSNWGQCSSSCISEGGTPIRSRQRSCSSPGPSLFPAGESCPGNSNSVETCSHLPHCTVDGAWGSWSAFSACPVTCGIGLEVSRRSCDSPAPKYGGQPCAGNDRQTRLCNTGIHCPVDGVWSEWSAWQSCTYPFRGRIIRCNKIGGSQSRDRQCLYREHNGDICGGDDLSLSQYRGCYDVNACRVKGNWEGWAPWSLCKPACGGKSRRLRKRICSPDYSDYRPTIGRLEQPAVFFGTPLLDCGDLPPGVNTQEVQPCVNLPACD